ncbi:MAG: hypothetical protein HXL63_04125 [Thermobifida sp.]|nr:hypothetical protein [Thermobifida sp.]
MNFNDTITTITDYLTDWGATHTVTDNTITITDGPGQGATLVADREHPYTINVTTGDHMVLIDGPYTSDPLTAAAVACFPTAVKIFDAGARIDDVIVDTWGVEITTLDSLGVTVLDRGDRITVTNHPLFGRDVDMRDIAAVVESAQLSYSPVEAWTILAYAEDFEDSTWEEIVEALCSDATFSSRDRLTHVSQDRDGQAALVEDRDEYWTVTDVDPMSLTHAVCHTHADVAATVLSTIAY